MTTLLNSTTATGATATEGDVKTYLTNLRTFMADLLGTDSANKAAVHAALSSILHGKISKTGAYTVTVADRGKVIDCSGTFTLSFSAAATLGDGFCVAIRNSGTGAITLDPSLSEQINGLTTFVLGGGDFAIVYCDGVSFSTVGGSSSPAGTVSAYAGATIPIGWLACNGAAVGRTTYAALFTAIGTTYGADDGSTTFNVPDLRGEFVRGLDAGRGVDSGRSLGSYQAHAFASHAHSETSLMTDYASPSSGGFGDNAVPRAVGSTTGATGGSETRPRNIAMNYMVKT